MIRVSYRASFSYMLRHPWQLALALLGVGIGVAVIVAVDLANASARKAFLLSVDKVTGEATHQVVGGPLGVDEAVYAQLRVENGLRTIAPVVSGTVEVNDTLLDVLGIDLFAEQDIRPFTSEASVPTGPGGVGQQNLFRSFLTEPGAVTMSAQTAAGLDLRPGDSFPVIAGGIERAGRLLGTYGNEQAGLDNVIIADVATAQAWLNQAGRLSRIDVRIAEGDDAALAKLEAALPDGVRALTAASRTQATVAMSQAFMTNLTAMSLLALLVGLFLIFNSVSFSVLQRRGLIAVVRALGFTRRELFAMILTEAALLGIVASALGVFLGVFLGEQLLQLVARSINDLYFRLSVTDVSVNPLSVVKGIAAGVGAAVVAAAAPALEAMTYEPRLAMSRSSLEQRAGRSLPYITLTGVVTMLAAVALLVLSGRNLVAGLAAVFLLIFGFALCVPVAVRWASAALTPAAQAAGGTPARIAVAGIADGLSRTAVAIVALAIAVSATIGVSVMVDSFRGSVQAWLEQSLQADIYTGVVRGSIQPDLVDDLRNIDGVVDVSTSRRTWIEDKARRTQLLAIRMAPGGYAGTELLDGSPDDVWDAWEEDDVVLVSEPYAYQNRVMPGDTVVLPTSTGDREFRVAARYQSYDINASAVMISRRNYDRYFDDDGVDTLGLYLAGGADVDDAIAAVKSVSDGRQKLRVDSNARIRDLSLEIFDQTFVITDVLYWLAIGVALIGILGAMLALQLERAREFALLRALGMTPGQVGGMITAQTGVIGFLSGVAAIPLGLIMAWVLIKVINRRAFGWQIDMAVAPDILISALIFAVGASLLAGLYPAWRAAQSRPAVMMREE
jgi:putative ABC transport system permease protein